MGMGYSTEQMERGIEGCFFAVCFIAVSIVIGWLLLPVWLKVFGHSFWLAFAEFWSSVLGAALVMSLALAVIERVRKARSAGHQPH